MKPTALIASVLLGVLAAVEAVRFVRVWRSIRTEGRTADRLLARELHLWRLLAFVAMLAVVAGR